ncbi:hypothetical protein PBRA_004643 [Plasmodiophora brassicae]|uniref:RAP domain-containing protein n=1 Tax=Plasmodiophora brassicae TaxID=37360 RepID=A0A0G4ILA4_PLABS|nr:hypothetical protein PBRA_004643 [Plasmodiophora brassicae]
MRATSSILTGMAKYDPQYRALFDTVLPILTDSAVLHAKFRHPTCRHLANCVHAVIKLGCLDAPRVLAALAPSIEARIDEFKAVELANIAWSYAKLNDAVVRTRVLEAVASAARTRLTSHNDFNAQGLSMMVWSYATAALPMVSLFDAFAPVIIERIGELAARNLANVAWAYGKVGLVNLPLFRAIASASKSLVLQFSTQNLANTLWAFMKVNFRDIELFESFAPVVIPRLRDMNNLELTSSVWSYAMIDIYVPALFEAAEAEAVARKGRLGSQQIANLLYSFAMVDRRPENVLPLIETIPAAFEREKCDGLLSQMHQWRLMVSDESFNEHMASIPGVRELFARCALAFQPVPPLNAALVADVRRILELTPFSTMFQAPTKCERTGFTTSMAHYTSDAFKVAVEILGPAQFITKTDQLKPSIRLKHRILAKHGWTLSLVTHADWHGLETDRDKVLFLSNRLETTLRAENMLM